jgi:hypothetical protein
MEYYSAIKKNEVILSFAATQMSLEDIMINEISQAQKDSPHILGLASLCYDNGHMFKSVP